MFFTVEKTIKIEGKPYKPCVCYAVTPVLEFTINKLAEEGKVTLHEKFVYFYNGKPLEQKAKQFEPATKPAKKSRTKKVEPEKFKEEVEELVSPAEYEAKDETEDF